MRTWDLIYVLWQSVCMSGGWLLGKEVEIWVPFFIVIPIFCESFRTNRRHVEEQRLHRNSQGVVGEQRYSHAAG